MFNRALRLRWRWLQWKESHKPWSQMKLCSNATEIALFRACTMIVIGDDKTTHFCEDRWQQGRSPNVTFLPLKMMINRNQDYYGVSLLK
jgi:hypothetical protein